MSSHIKTAYEYGVAEALKQAGYSSVAEFEKEAGPLALAARAAIPAAAWGSLIGAARGGEDHRLEGALKGGAGGALGGTAGLLSGLSLPGYLLGTNLGGYLGGGMAQEEPSELDKLRSRLGLDS